MKKLILILICLFFCFPSHGKWKPTGKINDNIWYLDFENIRSDNKFVYFYELIDFNEPLNTSDGKSMSTILYSRGDCTEMKFEHLNQTYFEKPMGVDLKVSIERRGKWFYPQPNSIGYDVLKVVCWIVKDGLDDVLKKDTRKK